jgi:hypothetical protein
LLSIRFWEKDGELACLKGSVEGQTGGRAA